MAANVTMLIITIESKKVQDKNVTEIKNKTIPNVTFENYNVNNGYSIKDVNTNAMYCDKNGIIWAGTGDKLIRFDYNQIQKSTIQPAVVIQNIKVIGKLDLF